jgi:hypothetical protein
VGRNACKLCPDEGPPFFLGFDSLGPNFFISVLKSTFLAILSRNPNLTLKMIDLGLENVRGENVRGWNLRKNPA